MMTPTWQPILAQQDTSRATAAIDAVAGALAGWPSFPEDDPFGSSLATGEAGLAVFFSYLDAARPGEMSPGAGRVGTGSAGGIDRWAIEIEPSMARY